MIEHSTQYRIRYADTDQMGVVYYGNYAYLYEIGRTELMRHVGISYAEIEQSGVFMPVIEMNSRYRRPLKYDEVITIKTFLKEIQPASVVFEHEIINPEGVVCNLGWVKLGFLNSTTLRPVRAPNEILKKIEVANML